MVIGISVGDDDVCHRRPFCFRNEAVEPEDPQILAWVDRYLCITFFNQKRVVKKVSDLHWGIAKWTDASTLSPGPRGRH